MSDCLDQRADRGRLTRRGRLGLPAVRSGGRGGCPIDLCRELALDRLGVERLHHVGELWILRQPMAEPRVEAGNELKGLGDLLLRAQEDVERDLLAQLGDACLATLRHEDENGEEDRLERDNHREQTERERVDRLETRDETGVPEDPGGEPEHMRGEEIAGARHAR